MKESQEDNLVGMTKADIQKATSLGFLILFGIIIGYLVIASDVTQITISGKIDVNQFWTVFVGIVIGAFTWLGFKTGQKT